MAEWLDLQYSAVREYIDSLMDLGDWTRSEKSPTLIQYYCPDLTNNWGLPAFYEVAVSDAGMDLYYTVSDEFGVVVRNLYKHRWTDECLADQIDRAFKSHSDFAASLNRRKKSQPNLGNLISLPSVTVPKSSSKVFKCKLGAVTLNWMFSRD
jgi:hypothetical protein